MLESRRDILKELIAMTKAIYDCANCDLLHQDEISKKYEVHIGVRQGCILLSILTFIVIDDISHD